MFNNFNQQSINNQQVQQNAPQNMPQNTQQTKYQKNEQIKWHHTYTYASKFAIQFHFISESKIGSDNKEYTKYGVMITIIPSKHGQQMQYDTDNSFSMKTSLDKVAALSGALLAAYYGQTVNYTIFTDSSKSAYSNLNAKKMVSVSTTEDGNIFLSASMSSNTVIKDSVKITRFDAYGLHKMLDNFINEASKIMFKNDNITT